MVINNHAPMFPIDLVEKDFRYIVQTAEEVNALAPVSNAIQNIYLDAIAKGYGENNITGVVGLFVSNKDRQ